MEINTKMEGSPERAGGEESKLRPSFLKGISTSFTPSLKSMLLIRKGSALEFKKWLEWLWTPSQLRGKPSRHQKIWEHSDDMQQRAWLSGFTWLWQPQCRRTFETLKPRGNENHPFYTASLETAQPTLWLFSTLVWNFRNISKTSWCAKVRTRRCNWQGTNKVIKSLAFIWRQDQT